MHTQAHIRMGGTVAWAAGVRAHTSTHAHGRHSSSTFGGHHASQAGLRATAGTTRGTHPAQATPRSQTGAVYCALRPHCSPDHAYLQAPSAGLVRSVARCLLPFVLGGPLVVVPSCGARQSHRGSTAPAHHIPAAPPQPRLPHCPTSGGRHQRQAWAARSDLKAQRAPLSTTKQTPPKGGPPRQRH